MLASVKHLLRDPLNIDTLLTHHWLHLISCAFLILYALWAYRRVKDKNYFDTPDGCYALMGLIHIAIGASFIMYWFTLVNVYSTIEDIQRINAAMARHPVPSERIGPPLDYTLALKLWRYIFLSLTYVYWFFCLHFDIKGFRFTNFKMLAKFCIVLLIASTLVVYISMIAILYPMPPMPPVP